MLRLVPVAVLLAALATPSIAQDRATTERRLADIRAQISGVEQEVRRARGVETEALRAIEQLGTELELRQELVSGYRGQVAERRRETEALQRSIERLEAEIDGAREAYRERAQHAYMHGRRSTLALLLASGSINQMLSRARYLQQFAGQRRRQVERIAEKTQQMRERERSVVTSLEDTRRLLTESQREQRDLDERRREHQTLVSSARERRGELERELRQRRQDAGALSQLVADLRAEERRAEQERLRQEELARQRAAAEAAARAEAERIAEAERRAEELSRRAMTEDERRTRPERRGNTVPAPPPIASTTPEPAPEPEEAPPPVAADAPPLEDRSVSLSGSFRRNRGSLPWPADGTVTGNFGTRTDAYGTTINAVGIDISTQPGAAARAVFEGTVERVGTMATFGTYVMVSHGDHTTIYGNLSHVVVRGGQRVRAGQVIGRAGTHEDRRGAGLFFAVYRSDGTPLNPVGWLRGR
ncbi:MAG: peptidoglycan DD-metalloendopeptidase family protein [Bacteroidota bacterium]